MCRITIKICPNIWGADSPNEQTRRLIHARTKVVACDVVKKSLERDDGWDETSDALQTSLQCLKLQPDSGEDHKVKLPRLECWIRAVDEKELNKEQIGKMSVTLDMQPRKCDQCLHYQSYLGGLPGFEDKPDAAWWMKLDSIPYFYRGIIETCPSDQRLAVTPEQQRAFVNDPPKLPEA